MIYDITVIRKLNIDMCETYFEVKPITTVFHLDSRDSIVVLLNIIL